MSGPTSYPGYFVKNLCMCTANSFDMGIGTPEVVEIMANRGGLFMKTGQPIFRGQREPGVRETFAPPKILPRKTNSARLVNMA